MSGLRPMHHTQWEVWITREASTAINAAALQAGLTRGEYIQAALWQGVRDHTDRDRELLFPPPRQTTHRNARLANPRAGYKGRWAMWVRARCTVHNSVPMLLTRMSREHGLGSASEFTRQALVRAIQRDLGITVPMPPGRSSSDLFGGKINEEVL